MHKILKCRRSTLALIGMTYLLILGLYSHADVGAQLVAIVTAVAGSNAAQAIFTAREKKD